jgi:hypothetical protein
MLGIRRAKNYYSTSQRKGLCAKNKPVARELKGLLWVVLRPNRRVSLPTYWSHPPIGADVLALGKQGRRLRLAHLFKPRPPSSFSSVPSP